LGPEPAIALYRRGSVGGAWFDILAPSISRGLGVLVREVIDRGPRVVLRRWFQAPYDDAIAAARTCYSDRLIGAEEVTAGQRERIGPLTFEAGHHTVYQHATFEFGLEGVSRQLVWSFLHRHPFYNTEQQSQRYVVLSEPRAHVPRVLGAKDREIYERAVLGAFVAYQELTELLKPLVRERLFELWGLSRRRSQEFKRSVERDIEKRSIETARYVIPVACETALIYTISGIVLHRLRRVAAASDVPFEAEEVVRRMVEEVEQVDPSFFRYVGREPLTEEEALESRVQSRAGDPDAWRSEFDASLGRGRSKLVGWTAQGPGRVADAVRTVLGLSRAELDDLAALDLVLDPRRNPHRLDTLNVSMHSPAMQALDHVHYTFRKRLSHTADSQDQRHRLVPGSRPLLSRHDTSEPDVVVPELIDADPVVRRRFDEAVDTLWEAKNKLVSQGVDLRVAQYLLPNARAVRFEESGSFLHLLHKWTLRTCMNAQREIFEASLEELEQVRKVHPELTKHVGPPCYVRDGLVRPRCTEGDHFCGVPVWRTFPEVQRTI
jgi:thymidylate synthase ThyX